MLLFKVLLVGSGFAGASISVLDKRQLQTEVICDPSFSWMSNAGRLSPCLVAAYVAGACGTNSYKTVKLLPNNRYDRPNSTSANVCTCSWAWYNLLAACTACQDMPNSIPTWNDWKTECPANDLSTTEFFPSSYSLAGGTTIPFYAGTNPVTWPGQQFDVGQAKSLSNEGHPDLQPSTQHSPKKSTPIGAIVGGVVGGLVVIGAAIIVFVLVRLRRMKFSKQASHGYDHPTMSSSPISQMPLAKPATHYRQMSNDSTRSLTSMGYMHPQSPTSPSVVMTTYPISESGYRDNQHSPSLSSTSTPFFPSHSMQTSPSPPPAAYSHELVHSPLNITPFVYHQRNTSSNEKHTRQGSHSTVVMYDDPLLPPTRAPTIDENEQSAPTTPRRPRVNPPAYSPPIRELTRSQAPSYAEANRGRDQVRPREKGLVEIDESLESPATTPTTGAASPHIRGASDGTLGSPVDGHSPSTGSISAIDEIIAPLGFQANGRGTGTATMEGLTIVTGDSQNLQQAMQNLPHL